MHKTGKVMEAYLGLKEKVEEWKDKNELKIRSDVKGKEKE